MKKKSPPIVKEYATLKEQYLDEKGTLEGYEEIMADIARQMREIAVKRTRPDGAVEPLPNIEPTAVEEVVEYETFKEQYLAEKGSLEGYDEMMANIAQQFRELAATGFRFDLKGEHTRRPKSYGKKKRRKA
jgi:hypothetical protein